MHIVLFCDPAIVLTDRSHASQNWFITRVSWVACSCRSMRNCCCRLGSRQNMLQGRGRRFISLPGSFIKFDFRMQSSTWLSLVLPRSKFHSGCFSPDDTSRPSLTSLFLNNAIFEWFFWSYVNRWEKINFVFKIDFFLTDLKTETISKGECDDLANLEKYENSAHFQNALKTT